MGEREGGESRSIGAFLVGFLLGVLLTLGGAGTFWVMTQRAGVMRAEMALREAEAARAEAERARAMVEQARKAEQEARALEDKKKAAAAGVKALGKAIEAFRQAHLQWPDTLEVLLVPVEGKPAILPKQEALIDPWGRQYVYDPEQRSPKDDVPLIYSEGPDPKGRKGRIRNWE